MTAYELRISDWSSDVCSSDLARRTDRNGLVVWAVCPSAPQRCSPELLKRVSSLAAEADLPIYTHVYETRLQRHFSDKHFANYQGSAIRYMAANGLLNERVNIAHGVWPHPEEIGLIADAGAGVVLNMLSNLRLDRKSTRLNSSH